MREKNIYGIRREQKRFLNYLTKQNLLDEYSEVVRCAITNGGYGEEDKILLNELHTAWGISYLQFRREKLFNTRFKNRLAFHNKHMCYYTIQHTIQQNNRMDIVLTDNSKGLQYRYTWKDFIEHVKNKKYNIHNG